MLLAALLACWDPQIRRVTLRSPVPICHCDFGLRALSLSLSLNLLDTMSTAAVFNGDEVAPFFGFIGAAAALVFSCMHWIRYFGCDWEDYLMWVL